MVSPMAFWNFSNPSDTVSGSFSVNMVGWGFWGEAQFLEHAVQIAEIDRAVLAKFAPVSALRLAELPAQRLVICEIGDH